MKKEILWTKIDPSIPFINLDKTHGGIDIEDEYDEYDEENENNITESISIKPNFDIYRLQTNFKLNQDLLQTLSTIDGIEYIQPISQYQLIIGLPNSGLFDNNKIKKEIEIILTSSIETTIELSLIVEKLFDAKTSNVFYDIVSSLQDSKPNWIVYVYPNSEFEIITDFENNQFENKLINMTLLQQSVGGFLAHSGLY